MIPAHAPAQRPRDARLLVIDALGRINHAPRSRLVSYLRPGDLVIANDAATMPASLRGVHRPTGGRIEVRLAGWSSLAAPDVHMFLAVVFGGGDFRTRTEDRPLPPSMRPGDGLLLGPLSATVETLLDHPRLIRLRFEGTAAAVWAGLARHGRPIQYAHVLSALALWDVWTPLASAPIAFEPPSATFAIDWSTIRAMRRGGVAFGTITLAAGISSTGDPELDRRLPFDEPYRVPVSTAAAIRRANDTGGRVVAIGTTVVRALEQAAGIDGVVRAGDGVARGRIGPDSPLRVVDAILSGTHEPDSSHYQLLRAFADDATLADAGRELEARAYRTHEFGDSVLIEKQESRLRRHAAIGRDGEGEARLRAGARGRDDFREQDVVREDVPCGGPGRVLVADVPVAHPDRLTRVHRNVGERDLPAVGAHGVHGKEAKVAPARVNVRLSDAVHALTGRGWKIRARDGGSPVDELHGNGPAATRARTRRVRVVTAASGGEEYRAEENGRGARHTSLSPTPQGPNFPHP